MITAEPNILQGQNPEASLQTAIVAEVRQILDQAGITYILIERFGLDIGVFIRKGGIDYARFIELKAFVGSRMGGVGFGNNRGEGPQVDLLLNSPSDLAILDSSVLWILGFGNRPLGSPRYSLFTSVQAKKASMGVVNRGKQNNLRINDLMNSLVRWTEVSSALCEFLFQPRIASGKRAYIRCR
jgi:hypothetical protein